MKTSCLAVLLVFSATLCSAQETFPGLKNLLTAAEWERAGMSKLTADEVGVIDAALIRYNIRTTEQLKSMLGASQTTYTANANAGPSVATNSDPSKAPKGWFERFGFPVFNGTDWRDLPPLRAKVTKWDGGNRFVLDNGQVWEGYERITYELPGKNIEIQARPAGGFALVVEGVNTTIRVMRLR